MRITPAADFRAPGVVFNQSRRCDALALSVQPSCNELWGGQSCPQPGFSRLLKSGSREAFVIDPLPSRNHSGSRLLFQERCKQVRQSAPPVPCLTHLPNAVQPQHPVTLGLRVVAPVSHTFVREGWMSGLISNDGPTVGENRSVATATSLSIGSAVRRR